VAEFRFRLEKKDNTVVSTKLIVVELVLSVSFCSELVGSCKCSNAALLSSSLIVHAAL